MSTKEKMQEAQQLIQAKRYNDAEKLLRTIDHPKAREWEAKLKNVTSSKLMKSDIARLKVEFQQVEDDLQKAEKNIRTATIVVLFCLFSIIGWILLPIALPQYFLNKRKARKLREKRLELTYKLAEHGL